MTTELTMLALSIVLGLVQIMIAANASTRQRGADWNVGSRDEVLPPLAGTAGRLDRALRNFLETFPLFAAAVLIAALAGRHNWMTEWGAVALFRRPRRLRPPLNGLRRTASCVGAALCLEVRRRRLVWKDEVR